MRKSARSLFAGDLRRHVSRLVALTVCVVLAAAAAWAQTKPVALNLSITDDKNQPVAGATVEVRLADKLVLTLTSAENGKASTPVAPGTYQLTVSKKGYLKEQTTLTIAAGTPTQDVDVVIAAAALSQQQVEVTAAAENPVTEMAPVQQTVQAVEAKEAPGKAATVTDALPLVPGVVRSADGSVHIAAMQENHSTLLINSVDVTDPATGNFGLTVPIDSVETIAVSESPYLAQYGRFTAGVVTAETRRGGEKWDYSINDPLPEFRIRSGHLEGLRTATPRINFSGPLIKNKLYLVEGSEYSLVKSSARTLPYPLNQSTSQAINSFTQLDYILSATHTLTGSFHIAPHSVDNSGLNFFNPIPVTPNAAFHPLTGTVTDRLAVGGGILQSIIAYTQVNSNVSPKGTADMVLSPIGNSGNYFSDQQRRAHRVEWIENFTTRTYHWLGTDHTLHAGTVVAGAADEGHFNPHRVTLQDANGYLLKQINFSGGAKSYSVRDVAPAVYIQDHWTLTQHTALDLGLRLESQSVTRTVRTAPRAGFIWSPDKSQRTVVRGGAGVFYDSVPLNVYAFRSYPEQTITTYMAGCDPANVAACTIIDGPRTYVNVVQTVADKGFLFVDRSQHDGNFAPYSVAWHVEFERRINPQLVVRAKYLQSMANNLLTLKQEYFENQDALVLGSSGSSHTRQFELTAQIGSTDKRRFYFSYVRQHARGTVNDAASYLSDFPFPVVRSDFHASLANEIPNRFLLWGLYSLPMRIRVLPKLELRNGFPWQPTTVAQDYVTTLAGAQPRFPRYFQFDLRVSKDLTVLKTHAIRLALTTNNLTNHKNYLEVHANQADPLYGTFFGTTNRRITIDFDWLF